MVRWQAYPTLCAFFGAVLAASRASAVDVALVDVTQGSGLETFTHSPNALSVPGLNEWTMGGIGVGDFDGDGWPDIFLTRGGTGTDRLYINNRNGTFTNRAAEWNVAFAHAGNGVACADFDRDGDVDMYVTSYGTATTNLGQVGRNRLYRNEGGTFTDVATALGVATLSSTVSAGNGAAWGDIDLDGDLDLAVAAWTVNDQANRLFRNDGGVFANVTGSAIQILPTWGFQPTIVDMTGDGFPELLLAADFETSRLYRNQRNGTFVDATVVSGVGIDDNGMGSCVADFDRDGLPDWYVTSVHMNVPNPGDWTGNAFYLSTGNGVFRESSNERGCNDGGWGWGAIAADLDHDGWEDIVEVNGRNASEWANEPEYVFRNLGGSFQRLGPESGLTLAADARSVVSLDYDRDGDLDILVQVNAGPVRLYRNDAPAKRSWLALDLVAGAASRCAAHGFGAVVSARTGSAWQRRFVHSGSGYQGSSEPVVHFGLGAATTVDELVIEWPSGQTTRLEGVAANARTTVFAPLAADLDGDGEVDGTDASILFESWGEVDRADRLVRAADIDGDGRVGGGDLAALLAAWTGSK
jgi:hypothetical protein